MNKTFVYQDVTYEVHLHLLAHIIDTTTGLKPDNQADIVIDYLNTQGYIIPEDYGIHHAVKLINKLLNDLPLDEKEQSFKQVTAPEVPADTMSDDVAVVNPTNDTPVADVATKNADIEDPAPVAEPLVAVAVENVVDPTDAVEQQEASSKVEETIPTTENSQE